MKIENPENRVRILTVCLAGITRSVGMADVLKFHFDPVDVIPIGCSRKVNSSETLNLLCNYWADWIIVMEDTLVDKLKQRLEDYPFPENKILLCNVGPDIGFGQDRHRPILIDKAWRWVRANAHKLGIKETR